MHKLIFLLAGVLFFTSAIAETVYKSKKPDGSVEFTDQASPDSEEIKIRKPTTYSPPRLPRLSLPKKKLTPNFNYELAITTPVNGSTILNTANVVVTVQLSPSLNTALGHQLQYTLGSQVIKSKKNTATFSNVDRGSHTINVSIIDLEDETVSPAVSATIYMKRFFKKTAPAPKPKAP